MRLEKIRDDVRVFEFDHIDQLRVVLQRAVDLYFGDVYGSKKVSVTFADDSLFLCERGKETSFSDYIYKWYHVEQVSFNGRCFIFVSLHHDDKSFMENYALCCGLERALNELKRGEKKK